MGNYENLKQSITEVIRTNGNQEITGAVLQSTLLTIISTVGANATFVGIATPTTNPGTPDGPVFYLASESGTYSNFGSIELQDGLSILLWNGSWSSQQIFGVDDVPTAGSDNLVKSGGVQEELALGAVYDVSAKNPTAGSNNDGKWESLSALLADTNLNTLIPVAVRKGGMSIKFVQSSDNKYAQYRLISDNWSIVPSDWQKIENINQYLLDKNAILFDFKDIESVGNVENGKNAQTSSTGSKVNIVNGDSTYNLLTYDINGEKYFKCKCTSYNDQRFGVGVYFADSDNNILSKWYSETRGTYIVTLSVPDGAAKIYINGIEFVPECTSGTLSDEPKYIAEITKEKQERENFDIELESKTVGTIVTHEFTSESYVVNLDFNYKAGDEVTIEVFTDDSINTRINGNSTTPYKDGNKYPYVLVYNGYGKVTYTFNEDGKLTVFGYGDGTYVTNEFVANFRLTIISNNNEFSAIKECSDIKNEIADIKGYRQVNSKVLNISSTVSAGDLRFLITANKKYLLRVDCSEPYNATLWGSPKLNYIDDKYYEDGTYPSIEIVNGQGSITISNNTNTSLSSWGFTSTEISASYEGNYTFTLFELIESSESLRSLRQSIDGIYIPQIAQANGFIRIFHSMGGIGDSLSSGEIVTGSGTEEDPTVFNDRYNFSWLANIARKYSADWRCFSNGGQTAQGWLERWLPQLTSEENKRSLYFIALGTNDEGLINNGQLALGTKDSSTDESSFAGYYKRIIESVHAYSEHSIIMCCTTYGKQTILSPINNLIQEISDLYDYCYFINIAQKSTFNLRFNDYERYGHFDTMGYVKIADAIEILVDEVIENNKTELATWGVNAPN